MPESIDMEARRLAQDARDIAQAAVAGLKVHEGQCGERWKAATDQMAAVQGDIRNLYRLVWRVGGAIIVGLFGILVALIGWLFASGVLMRGA